MDLRINKRASKRQKFFSVREKSFKSMTRSKRTQENGQKIPSIVVTLGALITPSAGEESAYVIHSTVLWRESRFQPSS